MSLFVVGDIHGMFAELEEMIHRIKQKIRDDDIKNAHVVFLGDYIDRGPDSKRVLTFVKDLIENGDREGLIKNTTALMGNHERMMIDAIDDPSGDMNRIWMHNGGFQCLLSYSTDSFDWLSPKKLIGYDMLKWISTLPKYIVIDNVAIAHAGINIPNASVEEHTEEDLLWSRNLRKFPHAIYDFTVHGHTPMDEVYLNDYVAYIDTGLVFGGKLTTIFIPDTVNPKVFDMVLLEVKAYDD